MKKPLLLLLCIVFLFISACVPTVSLNDGKLRVEFIDVGQGDSIFIRTPDNKTMLIDAAESDEFEKIDSILREYGVQKLDVVVATHPHADHIGGMKKVVEKYEIGTFYIPGVSHDTATFKKLLEAMKKNGCKTVKATAGVDVPFGDEVSVSLLAPVKDKYEDLNNYSAVMRLEYKESSFILTGDAESLAEKDILENDSNLNADVLKLGHHGSSTSSSDEFLDAVDPNVAIISAGEGNKYGHPHKETLSNMKEREITVYRTDKQGDITAICDGKTIVVETSK